MISFTLLGLAPSDICSRNTKHLLHLLGGIRGRKGPHDHVSQSGVQKCNRLFQKLNATEKELIKTLAPCCRENNVDETRPSNEKGIAMATSMSSSR